MSFRPGFRVVLLLLLFAACAVAADFRPPAVPLVTVDPYTSCWSMGDRLAADWPRHWTGKVHALCGFIRVDDQTFRFLGSAPEVATEARQTALEVTATQSIYRFAAGDVNLSV